MGLGRSDLQVATSYREQSSLLQKTCSKLRYCKPNNVGPKCVILSCNDYSP